MYRALTSAATLTFIIVSVAGCDQKADAQIISRYTTDRCAVESVNGEQSNTVYANRHTVSVQGWAVDTIKQATPKELRLRLTGSAGVPFSFGNPSMVARPDVAKAFNNDKLMESGFSFQADITKLEPGAYGIALEIPSENSLLVCQPKKILVVQ